MRIFPSCPEDAGSCKTGNKAVGAIIMVRAVKTPVGKGSPSMARMR